MMVQSAPPLISVDEFITRYGDDNRYELIDGELMEIEPTGPHEPGFLTSREKIIPNAKKIAFLMRK